MFSSLSGAAFAEESFASDVRPAELRVGLERLTLPGGESLGLLGTSYLVEVDDGWFVGPAAYGAVTGTRGGLFTLGVETAWRSPLAGPLGIELGLYAGAGGGGNAPVGGGLMLRPHADLMWDFGGFRAGVSASQVRFPSGAISSRQLGVVLVAKTVFETAVPSEPGAPLTSSGHAGVGFDRLLINVGTYRRSGGERPMGVAGARWERGLGGGAFWGLEAAGAASGGVAGYAEYLAGIGAEAKLGSTAFSAGARIAAGMGGGGGVDVGGGLMLRAAGFAKLRVSRDASLLVELGRTRAPQGRFNAALGSVAWVWDLDHPDDAGSPAHAVRSAWIAGVEHYRAARRDGTLRSVDSGVFAVNRFISPTLYLSGEAHSAFAGGAGGYSAGLVGVGTQWSASDTWRFGVQALIGAAGGGGVDTRGGAIAQAMAYASMAITPQLSLRAGTGLIRSLSGPVRSEVFSLALAYDFSVAAR